MVAGGGDKEASDLVWFELIICATVKSLVTDLPVNNSRKLSPRFRRANAFAHSCS